MGSSIVPARDMTRLLLYAFPIDTARQLAPTPHGSCRTMLHATACADHFVGTPWIFRATANSQGGFCGNVTGKPIVKNLLDNCCTVIVNICMHINDGHGGGGTGALTREGQAHCGSEKRSPVHGVIIADETACGYSNASKRATTRTVPSSSFASGMATRRTGGATLAWNLGSCASRWPLIRVKLCLRREAVPILLHGILANRRCRVT